MVFRRGPEYYRPPRLGIIHLLAWTAATAVLLKLLQALGAVGNAADMAELPTMARVNQCLILIFQSTSQAAVITGAGLLALGKARGAAGRLQPGHWILVLEAAGVLGSQYPAWVVWFLFADTVVFSERFSALLFPAGCLMLFLPGGAYVILAFRTSEGPRWKTMFSALAVHAFLNPVPLRNMALSGGWFGVCPIWQLVLGAVLAIVVCRDIRSGERRDWIHWLAVAVIAVGVLVSLAWLVFLLVFSAIVNWPGYT